jgi:hypothetical protein
MRQLVLLCALVTGCAASSADYNASPDPVMRDRSDYADGWNRDQCMEGNKEACDELRRSTAAKR